MNNYKDCGDIERKEMRTSLRWQGACLLVWGVVNSVMGAIWLEMSRSDNEALATSVIVVGVVQFLSGAWGFGEARAGKFLLYAEVMFLVAGLNIAANLDKGSFSFGLALGIAQIVWAFAEVAKYRRFQHCIGQGIWSKEALITLARRQRRLKLWTALAVGTNILVMAFVMPLCRDVMAVIASVGSVGWVPSLLGFLTSYAGLVGALGGSCEGYIILIGFSLCFPFVSPILCALYYLRQNRKATDLLKANGIAQGRWGARLTDFDATENVAEQAESTVPVKAEPSAPSSVR